MRAAVLSEFWESQPTGPRDQGPLGQGLMWIFCIVYLSAVDSTCEEEPNCKYDFFGYFDNIHLTLPQFMWGQYVLQIPASLLLLKGMVILDGRRLAGCGNYSDEDCKMAVAKLILNTSLAKDIRKIKNNILTFRLREPVITTDTSRHYHTNLTVKIDCTDPRHPVMLEAILGPEKGVDSSHKKLSGRDALILVSAYAGLINHPQIHSQANFATNLDHEDPFVRMMSCCTVLFNSYGNASTWLWSWGLPVNTDGGFQKPVFDHANRLGVGLERGGSPCPHSPCLDGLKKYSSYVRFVLAIRIEFMKLARSKKHKKFMKGVVPDALFQSTVMHSLDHANFEAIFDPLMVDPSKTNEYSSMARALQVARAGFTERLPGLSLMVPTLLKDAPKGSFYQELYHAAKRVQEQCDLDENFADEIECCVVR